MKLARTAQSICLAGIFLLMTCKTELPSEPETQPASEITILSSIIATPESIPSGGSARIVALVVDSNAEPRPGVAVRFWSPSGSITPLDSSNALGLAEAVFTAPQVRRPVLVFAGLGDQVDSVEVAIVGGGSSNLQILPAKPRLYANGIDLTNVRILVRDEEELPVPNETVELTTTAGFIETSVVTNSDGVASATLISEASVSDISATIRAVVGEAESFVVVPFAGLTFELEGSPQNLPADGRSTSRISAILKETSTRVAVPDAEIAFGVDLGTIANTVSTGVDGVAETDYRASTKSGAASVIAKHGTTLSDTLVLQISESTPTYLTLTADPAFILADGSSISQIRAAVSDQAFNPVPDGTQVVFAIIDGSGSIESQKLTSSGIATSILTSSSMIDTVLIEAYSEGLVDSLTVRYVVGQAARVTVTADSSSLAADGNSVTAVRADIRDASGNPIPDGTLVGFTASFGDITHSAETQGGVAVASYSSSQTGLARLTARAENIEGNTTLRLRPGPPGSILLSYDPTTLGVRDSGRNTTLTVTADVRDTRGNAVSDGTLVQFSLIAGPGGGEFLSSSTPVQTINGAAQVALNSGIRSGAARLTAEIVSTDGAPVNPPVTSTSTDIIIFAGPPYIETVNDRSTSRLSVGARRLNIHGWQVVNNIAQIVAVVGDRHNNPVPEGTAVYFTSTGGIIATQTGFTDAEGVVQVNLHSAQPYPTVPRYYETFTDPNADHPDFALPTDVIPGPIPDYENGVLSNGYDDSSENNGIARILASTEGVDDNGNSARIWGVTNVIFSGSILEFSNEISRTSIAPGEATTISITLYDVNGNPVAPGSSLTLEAVAGKLSWSEFITGDPGQTQYSAVLANDIDPTAPDATATTVSVSIRIESPNGNAVISTLPIRLTLN